MKRSFWILGILLLSVVTSACGSKENRDTASHNEQYRAHVPLTGEASR